MYGSGGLLSEMITGPDEYVLYDIARDEKTRVLVRHMYDRDILHYVNIEDQEIHCQLTSLEMSLIPQSPDIVHVNPCPGLIRIERDLNISVVRHIGHVSLMPRIEKNIG